MAETKVSDYNKLRITLLRIASGRHEDGTPLTMQLASRMAQLAIDNTKHTTVAFKYAARHARAQSSA